jgi:sulfate adenylyltransferase subunit 2
MPGWRLRGAKEGARLLRVSRRDLRTMSIVPVTAWSRASAEAARLSLTPHLRRLEAESIAIFREVTASFRNPVMLYSIGKDSSVLLRLAIKAFYPAPLPFPLLHIDTTWKFPEMIAFRDTIASELNLKLIVYINEDGLKRGVGPIASGSVLHTQIMKTDALKQALAKYGFDAAFGGARRDEEMSRAKERIFSFRSAAQVWDPRSQRPELWRLYNTRIKDGESFRVFPLSNWTELDVWQYIAVERIPVVPLYFAKHRPIVHRAGTLIMVADERLPLEVGEKAEMRRVRFRTLGCYPLSGAIESNAESVEAILDEMRRTRFSERQGRLIDADQPGSMERKKREGYF